MIQHGKQNTRWNVLKSHKRSTERDASTEPGEKRLGYVPAWGFGRGRAGAGPRRSGCTWTQRHEVEAKAASPKRYRMKRGTGPQYEMNSLRNQTMDLNSNGHLNSSLWLLKHFIIEYSI